MEHFRHDAVFWLLLTRRLIDDAGEACRVRKRKDSSLWGRDPWPSQQDVRRRQSQVYSSSASSPGRSERGLLSGPLQRVLTCSPLPRAWSPLDRENKPLYNQRRGRGQQHGSVYGLTRRTTGDRMFKSSVERSVITVPVITDPQGWTPQPSGRMLPPNCLE